MYFLKFLEKVLLKIFLKGLNVPTFLGGMARGLLGKSSEIQLRQCRKDALKEADLVVLIGKLELCITCILFINKILKINFVLKEPFVIFV